MYVAQTYKRLAMSKTRDDHILHFLNAKEGPQVEKAILSLQKQSCARRELWPLVGVFFSVTAEEEAARRGTLFAFDMEKRDLRASVDKVTKTAEELRKLNQTVAVRETFHFHQKADTEIGVMCD